MELDYNIFSLFDLLALIQGILFGTLLLIKNKSTKWLGVFLILFSLDLIPRILYDLNVYEYYPMLYGLPFNFYWIVFPIFYVYTQKVSIFSDSKIKYWLLYPGLLAYAVQLIIFLQPYAIKIDIFENIWYTVFVISGAFYSWIVGIWNFKLIKEHCIEVENSFSKVENKKLAWASTFLIFCLVSSIISLFAYYQYDNNIYSKIIYSVFFLLVIYWVSYHGMVQRNILFLLSNNEKETVAENDGFKVSENVPSKNENVDELMEQIDAYMSSSESFRQTELTIIDLAKNLNIHTKRISNAINTIRKQNFNTYVNNFRIEKAITLLAEENSALSIEGIGYEVGFHSKSAFYAAFKKVTGTTPSKYKQNTAA